MTKWLLLLGLYSSLMAPAQAQQRVVRGRIIDATDSQPLAGAMVTVKGKNQGTSAGVDGRFSLTVPSGAKTLVATFVGYVSDEINLTMAKDSVLIRLVPSTKMLNEVVVTGYGTAGRQVVGAMTTKGSSRIAATPGRPHPMRSRTSTYVMTRSDTYRGAAPDPQAGQLTAGEIHDYSKWTLWGDIAQNELSEYRALWRQVPAERYSVQLVSADGFPIVDVPIRLLDEQRQLIWQARTDNTGRAELWANLFRQPSDKASGTDGGKLSAEAAVGGKTYALNRLRRFGKGDNVLTTGQPCGGTSTVIDVAFVVDATGSMGDEIAYLKTELTDVIGRAKQAAPNSQIRLGSVFYRDHSDDYLTVHRDFDTQPDSAVAFIRKQSAAGGGDFPEAVDTALAVALHRLSWSPVAKARLLFLVLDAPPHNDSASVASLQRSVAKASALGIRLIPVAASGIDKSTEYLLRSMALGTNGTYVFLTDDSGIGDTHIKPTTDQYTVEKLNALLVRLMTKFTQTPDCQPTTLVSAEATAKALAQAPETVRYTEEGKPLDGVAPEPLSFRCFPNPTRDYLTVETAKAIDELFVMDITGKVLMRETPGRPTVRLDMQPYATGTYLFRFSTAQTWQAGRFLLNR